MPRLVLVHGAATTSRMWDRVLPILAARPGFAVTALERPRTGDLDREVAALAPLVEGAWLVGVSGGATLGLAVASAGVPLAGAMLHEPAVGSLEPGLLVPVAAAFAEDGTAGLGRALYGASWDLRMAGAVRDADTAAELAMFRSFEPAPLPSSAGRVVVTVGGRSPGIRHRSVTALAVAVGCEVEVIHQASHFAPHDSPAAFAAAVTLMTGGAPAP
jgi:pimeloyl-ACP methyl ester carboxylesterase